MRTSIYKRSSTRSEVWEFKGEIDKSRTFQWTPATWTNLLQPLYTSSISYYWISQNIPEKYFNEYFRWIFQIEPWQLEPTSFNLCTHIQFHIAGNFRCIFHWIFEIDISDEHFRLIVHWMSQRIFQRLKSKMKNCNLERCFDFFSCLDSRTAQ